MDLFLVDRQFVLLAEKYLRMVEDELSIDSTDGTSLPTLEALNETVDAEDVRAIGQLSVLG